jgi:hypothetical protein
MKFLIFRVFVISLILISCSRNSRHLELKGKVLDEQTKIAVPNRKIIVKALVETNKKLTPFYVGEFCTDDSGNFAYSLPENINYYLYEFCIVGDSSYGFSNSTLGLGDLYKYGEFLSFYLPKLTDFTIAIENKNKSSFDQTLYVSWRSNEMDGVKLYPYTIKNYGINDHSNTSAMPLKWTGGNIKSAVKTKVYADKVTIVRWELHRDWEVKEFYDTIFCRRDALNYVHFKY